MSAAIEFQASDRLPEPEERIFDSIVDLAPNPDNPTPMVRLSERINPHPGYEVLVKLEGMNPFGSIKDRTALHMLRGLRLRADQALVEPSAGNTGIALAAMANAGGTPIEIAVPDGTPEEKKALLRFLGAELIEVEDELVRRSGSRPGATSTTSLPASAREGRSAASAATSKSRTLTCGSSPSNRPPAITRCPV